MKRYSITVPNLTGTEAFGRKLGILLFPGAVVALSGELGAGKTHLTRAIAVGLNVRNPSIVTSPTFVLIQEYESRLPIYHFDAYRLPNEQAFRDLGAEEYFGGDGVCVVEWADRVLSTLPEDRLEIQLRIIDEQSRELNLKSTGTRHDAIIGQLADS